MKLVKKTSLALIALAIILTPSCSNGIRLTRKETIDWINAHQPATPTVKKAIFCKFEWDFSDTEEESKQFTIEKINDVIVDFSNFPFAPDEKRAETLKGKLWRQPPESSATKYIPPLDEETFDKIYPDEQYAPKIRSSIKDGDLCILTPRNNLFSLNVHANQIDAYNQKCYLDGMRIEFEHEYTYEYCINGWLFVKYVLE